MTARLGIILAILLIVGAAFVFVYRADGIFRILDNERQNNAAGDASDKARSDHDICVDGGGVFDFATGKCLRAAPRRRN